MSYQDSLAKEQQVYENCVDVHGLPPIFHYWSDRHLLPKLRPFGFKSPNDMFAQYLEKAAIAATRPPRFVSLGAGNCDMEVDLARSLKAKGYPFTFDCLDLNPAMLERGRLAAESAGVSAQLNVIAADLNRWQAVHEYDAIIANQSLHHVVNLEGLFENVKRSLRPGGTFLISDMIGRNGHQRWPEALAIVHEFWRKLPPSYRFNQMLGDYEELYENWDCSVEGFEGVRSQDILPLLVDQFHFHLFIPYGNIIDPFIDRALGHHFDPDSEWDRAFIDAVHHRDELELGSGRLKPTHMIAVLAEEPSPAPQFSGGRPPRFSIRAPEQIVPYSPPSSAYDWHSWPNDPQAELEIACRRLAEAGREVRQRTAWALGLQSVVEQRTEWALRQEKDLQACTEWASRIEKDFEDRTAWALTLEEDVAKLRQKIAVLEPEVERRTLWALQLKQELAEQTSRADRLERELYKLIHNPMELPLRLLSGIRRRFFHAKFKMNSRKA
ncbi:MAG: methyltransferase [Bryobacteraceae bacterium]